MALDKVIRYLALNVVSKQALEGLFHLGHHLDSLNKKSEVITFRGNPSRTTVCPSVQHTPVIHWDGSQPLDHDRIDPFMLQLK